jgi:hypothetical protein
MLKAERQKAADDLTSAQTAIPEGETGSLLGLGVPSGADEYQGGDNTSLKYSKEDARYQQTLIALSSRCRCGSDAPEDNINPENFACRKSCQDMTWVRDGSA